MNPTAGAEAVPRFCPHCAREVPPYEELCRYCGDRTEPQGFCGVCESYALARIGVPCPKHELPLEEGPGQPPVSAAGGAPIDWKTLARFDSLTEAEGPRLRLESEGIPTFLDGVRMAAGVMNPPAIGGIKLQVPAALADDARVLLDQSWDVPADDLDDAWEELGPEPGARRRAIMKWAIVVILALPLLVSALGMLLTILTGGGRR